MPSSLKRGTVVTGLCMQVPHKMNVANMEFSVLGVVVVVISKNIYYGLDHRDGSVEKVFAKQAEGLGSPESMWKPAEMAAAWKEPGVSQRMLTRQVRTDELWLQGGTEPQSESN